MQAGFVLPTLTQNKAFLQQVNQQASFVRQNYSCQPNTAIPDSSLSQEKICTNDLGEPNSLISFRFCGFRMAF
jgi:hypothetical protein